MTFTLVLKILTLLTVATFAYWSGHDGGFQSGYEVAEKMQRLECEKQLRSLNINQNHSFKNSSKDFL